MRELTTRSTIAILALPELEVLIHQCNVALAVGCLLALLKQYRSIQSNGGPKIIIRPGGPYNMYAWLVHKIN